jgi:predicted transcriptional regulator
MNTYGTVVPRLTRIRNTATLSRSVTQQLKWMDFYATHGSNARFTCRHFSLSPDVFYAANNDTIQKIGES